MPELLPLAAVDASTVERLLDRAFGADRQQRTAYRVRAGTTPLPALSLAALAAGELAGSIQCWPVAHHGDDGIVTPLVMVGPVAVDPARQRDGLGRLLMTAALERAADALLMLIGDPEYYARFFAFSAARTGAWRLPGPFAPRRLLARGEVPDGPGLIGPRNAGIAAAAGLVAGDADGRAA